MSEATGQPTYNTFIVKLTYGLSVVLGTQEQLGGPVPESDNHRVQVCQWLERGIEQASKPHVS